MLRDAVHEQIQQRLLTQSMCRDAVNVEIQQRLQKLTVEAGGIYSAAWGATPVGHTFAHGGMSGYLASRAYTIYGGASEVQRDVIAKNVLGLKK